MSDAIERVRTTGRFTLRYLEAKNQSRHICFVCGHAIPLDSEPAIFFSSQHPTRMEVYIAENICWPCKDWADSFVPTTH